MYTTRELGPGPADFNLSEWLRHLERETIAASIGRQQGRPRSKDAQPTAINKAVEGIRKTQRQRLVRRQTKETQTHLFLVEYKHGTVLVLLGSCREKFSLPATLVDTATTHTPHSSSPF